MKINKKILGLIVLSVVIGFLLIACSDPDPEYTWKFDNKSSYVVNIKDADFSPSAFSLDPDESRTFVLSNSEVNFLYGPSDKVDYDVSTTTSGGTWTFTDK